MGKRKQEFLNIEHVVTQKPSKKYIFHVPVNHLPHVDNNILTITINRPDKLNALNKTVIEELGAAIDGVYNNPEIKSAIITGSGPKGVCGGRRHQRICSTGWQCGQGAGAKRPGHAVFSKIENSPKPIVAAVNGFALGGGCELAMACHFRLCSDNAKFGQPEVNLGLVPGYGGTQRLTQLIGKGKAMELMMTGNLVDANEAKQLGLVNYVTTAEDAITQNNLHCCR